jgi:hypothetical protein
LSEIDFAWSAVGPNSSDGKSKLPAVALPSSGQHHGTATGAAAAVSPENDHDVNVNLISGAPNITTNSVICKDDPFPSASQQPSANDFSAEESVIQV